MHSQTKFIVWDWNGTLIEDLQLNVVGFNISCARAGLPPISTRRYQDTFVVPIEGLYRSNGFSDRDLALNLVTYQHLFHDAYDAGILNVDFRNGARDILRDAQASGSKNIILSNHLSPSIDAHLAHLKGRHLFSDILAHASREAQSSWTPKIDRLIEFMNQHGLQAENGIIVGDTPEETHIARQTGLTSIAISGGFATEERLNEAKPDFLFQDYDQFRPVLEQRGFLQ